MRLARLLGAIGRALISAGVIVLLFVAYQLWGTGLQHQAAQGNLEDDFLRLLDSDLAQEAALAADDAEPEQAEQQSSDLEDQPTGETAALEPQAEAEIVYSPEFLGVLYPPEGESLARIRIPAINVDQIVVAGVSVEDLRKGPGHYPNTPNPGQAGNAAIAGHRTTYGAPFHRVDELLPGDEITVTTIQGSFTYRVRANESPTGADLGHFIVTPSDTWVLGQDSDENLLTLTACHPKYSARERIIVQAELVGQPAATPPKPDNGEEDADEPLGLDAGAEDERAQESPGEAGAEAEQVIGDDVAADDDPSVDEHGNPIDGEQTDDPEPECDTDCGIVTDGEGTETSGDPLSETGELGELGETASGDDGAGSGDDPVDTDQIELIDGEVADDDFGEGLDGDPTKIRPAIMWGLAGGAIWLAAWFVGKRLNRKWTLYVLGLVPFAPALWSCFVNIDQALPSY